MKKYIIKDNSGNKKTIYARNLTHALKIADNKVKDAVSLVKGDWFTLRQRNDVLYKVIDDQNKTVNGFREAIIVEVYRIALTKDFKDYTIKKVGNESFHPERWSSSDIVIFNSAEEAMNWLKRQLQLTKHRSDSKVKDEANLATTIQALVNDEEAAVKAYEVAIKNLEGKIDETQMQVLINIMKDERRHIENLYAVLNGQVTEKNLEDSKVRDGKHTDKFARILRSKGINFSVTPNGEIKFNNRNDFKRALDLAEDYSFEFGGYDYDERNMLIEIAESI